MRAINLKTTAIVLATMFNVSAAKIIYVDNFALMGANNGTSWMDACMYLHDALMMASTGDEIRVARGTYYPGEFVIFTRGHRGRMESFHLKNGVAIRGGYAGTGYIGIDIPDPNERDIELYETILSGDLNGNDVEVADPCDLIDEPTRADNCYHVVTASYTDETAVLDGFTITAGYANGSAWEDTLGGGMYIESGRPTVSNCTFSRNWAKESGGALQNIRSSPTLINCTFNNNFTPWSGGGIDNFNSNSPILTNCTFSGNSAEVGGGLVNYDSNPTMNNCTFSDNRAESQGGGVYNQQGNPKLTNCAFTKNSATWGGGMCNQHSSPQLIDCAFNENWASSHGGGLCNIMSNPTVTDCTFMSNAAFWSGGGITYITSTASGRGGPIIPPDYVADSESSLHNCIFSSNSAYGGGAIYNNLLRMKLFNCIFTGNSANTDRGGAIYNNWPGETTLTNCTVSSNRAANYAGGIYGGGGDLTFINNCIVWANTTIKPSDVSERQIQAVYNINYSFIQSFVSTRIQDQDNIALDPCFADPGYWDSNGTPDDPNDDFWIEGDYHLKSQAGRYDPNSDSWIIDDVTSPCIDAGDPNSPIADEPKPNGDRINMGAYGGTWQASKSYTDE